MDTFDESKFNQEVVNLALQMQLSEVLEAGKLAIPLLVKSSDIQAPVKKEDIDLAITESNALLAQPSVRDRLCPALKSVSDDIREVAKVVSAAMLPLALIPGSVIPLSPLVFAAFAVVIVRAGIKSICPPDKE
jgi:hypothetical protein